MNVVRFIDYCINSTCTILLSTCFVLGSSKDDGNKYLITAASTLIILAIWKFFWSFIKDE